MSSCTRFLSQELTSFLNRQGRPSFCNRDPCRSRPRPISPARGELLLESQRSRFSLRPPWSPFSVCPTHSPTFQFCTITHKPTLCPWNSTTDGAFSRAPVEVATVLAALPISLSSSITSRPVPVHHQLLLQYVRRCVLHVALDTDPNAVFSHRNGTPRLILAGPAAATLATPIPSSSRAVAWSVQPQPHLLRSSQNPQ